MTARLTGSSDGTPIVISDNDDKESWRAYSLTEYEVLPRSSHNKLLVKDQVQQGMRKTRESMKVSLYFTELKVNEPANDLFSKALNCRTNRLIENSARYDDVVMNELHRMTKKISVQMKDRTFF